MRKLKLEKMRDCRQDRLENNLDIYKLQNDSAWLMLWLLAGTVRSAFNF